TGFIIEVFFSHEMSPDAALFSPSSYTLTAIEGGAPSEVLSVASGVPGAWGPTSVLLHHTGTTLGGLYRVTVDGPIDTGGTPIGAYAPLNQADVLCKGEPPPYTITPISGTELVYEFAYDMLPESEFSPGILDLNAYGFTTNSPYPITPTSVDFPYGADLKKTLLTVQGMTSAQYVGIVSPALALDYLGDFVPGTAPEDFNSQEVGEGDS
ncbi:MAG: hypothetical protein GY721_14050, partial [Deltaproteobacteria bacterium]|nr:hypothetical protein [Deltaproteobacteria bacterium]